MNEALSFSRQEDVDDDDDPTYTPVHRLTGLDGDAVLAYPVCCSGVEQGKGMNMMYD